MPKGESDYAHVEVDFFSDSRVQQMTDRSKLGYLAWWFTAIKERREVLLPHQSEPSKLAVRTGISLRAVKEGLASGQSTPGSPLIIAYETGHVRVCGVRKKHANLKNWHDDEDAELRGRLAPESPDRWGQTRASSRSVPCRAVPRRTSPPDVPPQPEPKDALGQSREDGSSGPLAIWLKYRGTRFTQADRRFIEQLWDEFSDVQISLAMAKAIEKKGNLGLVRKILKDEKAQLGEPVIFTGAAST